MPKLKVCDAVTIDKPLKLTIDTLSTTVNRFVICIGSSGRLKAFLLTERQNAWIIEDTLQVKITLRIYCQVKRPGVFRLIDCSLWWSASKWMKLSQDNWPMCSFDKNLVLRLINLCLLCSRLQWNQRWCFYRATITKTIRNRWKLEKWSRVFWTIRNFCFILTKNVYFLADFALFDTFLKSVLL